jgi:hypothetical protein
MSFLERLPRPCFDPLTIGSLAVSAIGAGVGAMGTMAAGQSAKQLGQFQQKEFLQQGEEAESVGQRKMLEQQRQGNLVQSQLIARAAGSGASADSPTVMSLSRQIAGRSEYSSLMDLWAGQNQQAGLLNQGSGAAYSGELTDFSSKFGAAGTLAGGLGSMFRTLSFKGGGVGLPFSGGGTGFGGVGPGVQLPGGGIGSDYAAIGGGYY